MYEAIHTGMTNDHDDQWANIGLLSCYMGDHWWWWMVAQWLGYYLGNVNRWLFRHYHTKMTIKWWITDYYPNNDNGRQPNDGSWTPMMMPTQNEMMNTIKKIMATYNCHTTMMINETMNRRENIMCTYHHHTMVINFAYTKWDHEQKGKQLWELAIVWLSHHDDDQFYLHKMRPWTKGGKMMGTYHRMIVVPRQWSIMFNAYTKWEHEGC
jgi:hypothetical protein